MNLSDFCIHQTVKHYETPVQINDAKNIFFGGQDDRNKSKTYRDAAHEDNKKHSFEDED